MFGRHLSRTRALRAVLVAVLGAIALPVSAGRASADPAEAKKIFTTRCMACHTFGKGVKVGPDLKGVTERRQRAWLLRFIRSSQTVIGSGDGVAAALFEQFKQQRMPDWTDLSEAQIGGILDWLAIGGPDQQEVDARDAASATPAELDAGRQLFHGERALARGGLACGSCHRVREPGGGRRGGTLACDLTTIYSQYQDGAMTQFLRHPCSLRVPESETAAFLAPEESFALKAYLREVARSDRAARATHDHHAASPAIVAKAVDGPGPGDGPPGPPGPSGGAAAPPSTTGRVAWAPGSPDAPAPRLALAALPGELLFLVFPYVALILLVTGLGVRHAIARQQPDSITAAAASAWQRLRGTRAWRVGLAATAAGHLLALLVPGAVRAWNGAPLRLYLLEGSGFLLGAIALAGLVQLLWRHARRGPGAGPARRPGLGAELADDALLSLGCVAIASGLAIALVYRWGSSWELGTLVPYIASLARGAPAAELVQHMPFLVRLHVFSWFAILALLPFTSAAMILVAAGDRAMLLAARPLHAAGRLGERALARLSPARWLWPEEDAADAEGAQGPDHTEHGRDTAAAAQAWAAGEVGAAGHAAGAVQLVVGDADGAREPS